MSNSHFDCLIRSRKMLVKCFIADTSIVYIETGRQVYLTTRNDVLCAFVSSVPVRNWASYMHWYKQSLAFSPNEASNRAWYKEDVTTCISVFEGTFTYLGIWNARDVLKLAIAKIVNENNNRFSIFSRYHPYICPLRNFIEVSLRNSRNGGMEL